MDKTSSANKRSPRPILVVGNNTQTFQALSLLLQRFGYDVSTTHTAIQALNHALANRPDLIIADQDLFGSTGMELFQKLQRTRATESIPVILMVYPGDASTLSRCRDWGVAGCIRKPVLADELYRAVQSAIEPRPRASIRIEARLPVAVDNVPLDCCGDECEVGLSLHGMYVPLNKHYPRNSRLTIRMIFKDRTISAEGSVLYSSVDGSQPGQRSGLGLKFVTIDPQDQEFIGRFIRDEVTRDISTELSQGTADA